MVARPGTYQASNNAGELKPELHGRTDIKQFYSGLATALNVEPVPQGGSRLSPRSRHIGRIRNVLAELAPNSSAQSLGPHDAAATIAELSFAASKAVSVVVMAGFSASQALDGLIAVEFTADGATWQAFAGPFNAATTPATLTAAAPPRAPVTAKGVRLRLTAAPPSATTFTLAGFTASRETATLPQAVLRPFTFSLEQSYVVALADHGDIYRDGAFVGAATTGLSSDIFREVVSQQRFDTMLLFHDDIVPVRIFRNKSDREWLVDAVPFTNVPKADLGGTYTNQVTDVWKIYLRYPTSGTYAAGKNLYVSLSVNGEETAGVATGDPVNWTTFKNDLVAAIEDLPSIEPGVTITESHAISGLTIVTLSFTGQGNNGDRNAVTAQVVNTSEAAATVTHTALGSAGGEDLMSVARGWPACATFFQDRLVMGGFKAKKSALLASVTGEYYDTNIEIAAASGAILVNLDTEGAEKLHRLARARHLVMFTTDAEYFVSDRALNATAVPNIVNCSRNGSATGVPVVENEGALLYVSRNGALIYAASYDDVSQAYVSAPISLLASHIASDVIDMALQKASTATDAARLWMVRADGTMTLGVMLRNQDVTAFVRWQTNGMVKAVCVDGANVPHILVERMVDGAAELHLEQLELDLIFDGTITQSFGAPVMTVTGLEAHEGATVWAEADGYVVGPFTVSSGAIELPAAASEVSVGRYFAPDAITLPLPSELSDKVVLRRPKRVHTVRVDLIDTTSIAVGANGRTPRDVPLYRAGDPVDAPLAPVSRTVAVSGIGGFTNEGQVRITQVRPGRLAWRGIVIEART